MPSNFFSSAHAAIFSASSSNSRQVYLVISPLESAIENTLYLFYPKISCQQRALYMNVDASPHVLRWRLLTLKFLSIKTFRGFLQFSLSSDMPILFRELLKRMPPAAFAKVPGQFSPLLLYFYRWLKQESYQTFYKRAIVVHRSEEHTSEL